MYPDNELNMPRKRIVDIVVRRARKDDPKHTDKSRKALARALRDGPIQLRVYAVRYGLAPGGQVRRASSRSTWTVTIRTPEALRLFNAQMDATMRLMDGLTLPDSAPR